jgi:hypothetical protein
MRLSPLLLLPALLLTGCSATDELRPAAAVQQQSAAAALAADLRPLHAEAVELADLVLAAGPDAAVADVVSRVAAESRALLAAAEGELRLAADVAGDAGVLTAAELEAVRSAAGDEAVRLGVDGLLRNQLTTVQRAKEELAEDGDAEARALAEKVLASTDTTVGSLASLS